jgi:hypothetical protein
MVIINGSPKTVGSTSSIFIDEIKRLLDITPIVYQSTQLILDVENSKVMSNILEADVLLFVFPLYVDCIPVSLIKILTTIEQEAMKANEKFPIVYAISNCGFIEAKDNHLALDIVKNFATSVGMLWGYGIGIGGGGFVASQSKNMRKSGPVSNVYAALVELASAMKNQHMKNQHVFVTPKIPRFMYKFGGNLGWYLMGRKYGTVRSLKTRPHAYKK